MRLHVLSDLHLERDDWRPASPPDVDVVILAGDLHRGTHGLEWARASYGDLPIIYIPGNHEYHQHSMPELWQRIRDWGAEEGIHVLEQESIAIDGMRFFGTALWTDMGLYGDPEGACERAAAEMSDYRETRFDPDGRMLHPHDTMIMNRQAQGWLRGEIEAGRTHGQVIITHHAPSERCIRPDKRGDELNVCFASHHDQLVADSRAALWVYGHTHWSRDFRIGDVRVLSNQRGYPDEDTNGFDGGMVVEL